MDKTLRRMRRNVIEILTVMLVLLFAITSLLVDYYSGAVTARDMIIKEQVEVNEELYVSLSKQQYEIAKRDMAIMELEKTNKNIKKQLEEANKVVVKKVENKISGFSMTHYTATCNGCTGYTKAKGINVKNTIYYKGRRVIAVDPNVIPLGSIVEISDGDITFKAQAVDTGGAIKGKRIDLLVKGHQNAIDLGRKEVSIKYIRKGW